MRDHSRDFGVTKWLKIGFLGVLGALAGFVIDKLGFHRIATAIFWIAWTVAAIGLLGHWVVHLKKWRDQGR